MIKVTEKEAQEKLEMLLEKATAGETILISRDRDANVVLLSEEKYQQLTGNMRTE